MTRVYEEIIDFVAGGTSPSGVAAFAPAETARALAADLLAGQKTNSLSPEESARREFPLPRIDSNAGAHQTFCTFCEY